MLILPNSLIGNLFQDLIKESEQKKTVIEKTHTTSKTLLDAASKESRDQPVTDQEVVAEEVKFVNQTWRTVTEKLGDVKKQADNIDKELVVFFDKERALEDMFEDIESTIEKQATVSTNPEKCTQEQHVLKVS